MTYIETFFLGLLQGIAEFLPISSSGHLSLLESLFHIEEAPLTINIALHAATLIVILIFFRKKILSILFPLRKEYVLAIILTSIPTALLGLSFKLFFKQVFAMPVLSGFLLLLNGLYLFWVAKLFKTAKETGEEGWEIPNVKQSLIIGIAQGIAVLPGLSRSGLTIGISKKLGMNSRSAVEYSLIASLPAITGAVLLEAKDMTELNHPEMILFSAVIAMISGWLAVKILLKIVDSGSFQYWGMYCIAVGLVFLGYTYAIQ